MPSRKSALKQIFSQEFLSESWDQMYLDTPRKKRASCGVDGQTLHDFNHNASKNIESLSVKVLNDQYHPSPLKPFFIPKANGKVRVICVPTVTDRLVQRAVLTFLNQNGLTLENPISHGFIYGYSKAVERASQKAAQYRKSTGWAYKADISAFFDRVDRNVLDAIITKKIKYPSIHKLLKQSIRTEILCTSSEKKLIQKQGILQGVGLRQGMPISPYLANLYLKDFDEAIITSGIKMVRYADDLIAFGNTMDECQNIHSFCCDELQKLSLEIHDIADGTKTVIAEPDQDIEFLGICISRQGDSYQLVISKEQIAKLAAEITKYSSLSYCAKHGIRMGNIMQIIDSKVSGYLNSYDFVMNKNQLTDKLNHAKKTTLRNTFLSIGIDLNNLPAVGKKFLGLHE